MRYILTAILLLMAEWIWASDKPNIIIILSDDAGYSDFGFRGNKEFKTPYIDSIAGNGVNFTNGYVSGCVCSPSRAGLLTGRYQSRFGHENNLPPGHKLGLPLEEVTIADNLKKQGYTTGIIGKWHLGYEQQYHPNKRGFDWFYGCLQGSRSYWRIDEPSANRVIQFNDTPTAESSQYMTDRLGDNAVKFINENKARPFFLYLSFTAVHGPYQSKPEDTAYFDSVLLSKSRKNLAGMTRSLDQNVGKVLKALKGNKILNNTLLVFLNDNGGTGPALNTPLYGKKGTLYEGGVRVPFCLQWPAKIKHGQVLREPVIALDLLPTAVAAAGMSIDPSQKVDGKNLLPYLKGDVSKVSRKLFWRKHTGAPTAWAAVRDLDWKLHKLNGQYKLFNLSRDPQEQKDVKEQYTDIFNNLKIALSLWESEMVPPLFGKGAESVN